ncbi:MAG: glycoside hydrolase family 2 [Acidobacteriota bacterium]|nr:glycoside hydrolase family 2 [Acidobacteriota bacterium]
MNTHIDGTEEDLVISHAYPRPLLERTEWTSLNGKWEFALDKTAVWTLPDQVVFDRVITVPFSPETPASGVGDTSFYRAVWYRRTFEAPELKDHQSRLLLHFGAVDYVAIVWVNGSIVCSHEGGYTPFEADVTDFLTESGPQTVVVRAEDDPSDLAKPRGKQDWQLEPHSIWYPRTTGIWQTVWFERVHASYIGSVHWTPNLERWEIGFEASMGGLRRDGLRLSVKMHVGNLLVADDMYAVVAGEVHRRIALSDPGIDDYRNDLLWSPSSPTLIHAQMQLWGGRGELLDTAHSYTALRSIGVQGDRFVLNGRPYPLRMVLDQGYWPESGLTAPDDDALRRDVELAKSMGFNGVRKHQKIEDPRYLYWADTLGLLVWEEMPSAYRFTRSSIERLAREWTAAIGRDSSHPCIVAWVPFNESWGVPDLPDSPAQRHYVQALYHLTKTLDPTRPVIGNDGWESVATDIIGIHDYDDDPERVGRRYGVDEVQSRLFKRERPGGRLLLLEGQPDSDQPIMLSEFGGIALSPDLNGTWGYTRSDTAMQFAERYGNLLHVVRVLPSLAGFCYTQFCDTYQEANGLLYADRTPKFPIEEMAAATRGPRTARDRQVEFAWRERIMNFQRHQYLVPAEDYRTQDRH